jgi:site-specific DNA-methyltransferase (adenine-specific)
MQLKVIYKPTKDLIPYVNNSRKHSEKQITQIAASIKEFGFNNPILLDGKNGLIAGHGRLEAAIKLDMDKVPTIEISHLSEAQKKAYIIADNQLTLNADWDRDALKLEFEFLNEAKFDLDLLGFDEKFQDLLNPEKIEEGKTDPDEIPENVETRCKPGDLWKLGEHRLLCGDSTNIQHVERLMDGQKADMVFTDPPYGVSYVGKTKDALTIESDDFDEKKLTEKNTEWFNCVDIVTRPGAYLLATVPAGPLHLIFAQDWKNRGWLRQIMVWNKSSMVMGHSEYHYKHEPILFGWKPGERLKNNDRTKTTVWDFQRPSRSVEHPTMKPVEMWEYGIINHTKKGFVLYEPFSGSGTSFIACEKTGRKCYGLEIDPHYVSVAIERWMKFTGKEAYRLEVDGSKKPYSQSK